MGRKRARTESNAASNKKKSSASANAKHAQTHPEKSSVQIAKEEQMKRSRTLIAVTERLDRLESRIAQLDSYQTKYNIALKITLSAWARAVLHESLGVLPPPSPAYVDEESDENEVEYDVEEKSVGQKSPHAVTVDIIQKWAKAIGADCANSSDYEEEEKEDDVNWRVRVPRPQNLSLVERLMRSEIQFLAASLDRVKWNKVLEIVLRASALAVGVDVEALPRFPPPPSYIQEFDSPPAYIQEFDHEEEEDEEEEVSDEDEED